MAILKSSHTGWDGKTQGNMTQAMTKGEMLQDVISIPSTTAIAANDIVWLKNYPSSTVITDMELSRGGFGSAQQPAAADVNVKACLLGIDSVTKEPFAFKYGTEGAGGNITDNLFVTIVDGSANTHKVSGVFKLDKAGSSMVSLSNASYCRCEKQTVATTAQVANADVDKVWKNARDDETLAMIAEWTMSDLYTTGGAASGKAAANYDPSTKSGYMEFGIGLAFTTELTIAQLEALQLKVAIKYKDSMVSETSYGKNYIPVQVTY